MLNQLYVAQARLEQLKSSSGPLRVLDARAGTVSMPEAGGGDKLTSDVICPEQKQIDAATGAGTGDWQPAMEIPSRFDNLPVFSPPESPSSLTHPNILAFRPIPFDPISRS